MAAERARKTDTKENKAAQRADSSRTSSAQKQTGGSRAAAAKKQTGGSRAAAAQKQTGGSRAAAAQKQTGGSRTAGQGQVGNRTGKQGGSKPKQRGTEADMRRKEAEGLPTTVKNEMLLVATGLLSLLLILSYFGLCGKVGSGVNYVCFGLMGYLAYLLPFLLFFGVAFGISNRGSLRAYQKLAASAMLVFIVAALLQMITGFEDSRKVTEFFTISAEQKNGGGIFGALFSVSLTRFFGKLAANLILVALLLIHIMLLTGKALLSWLSQSGKEQLRRHKELQRLREEEFEQFEELEAETITYREQPRRARMVTFTGMKQTGQEKAKEEQVPQEEPLSFYESLKLRGRAAGPKVMNAESQLLDAGGAESMTAVGTQAEQQLAEAYKDMSARSLFAKRTMLSAEQAVVPSEDIAVDMREIRLEDEPMIPMNFERNSSQELAHQVSKIYEEELRRKFGEKSDPLMNTQEFERLREEQQKKKLRPERLQEKTERRTEQSIPKHMNSDAEGAYAQTNGNSVHTAGLTQLGQTTSVEDGTVLATAIMGADTQLISKQQPEVVASEALAMTDEQTKVVEKQTRNETEKGDGGQAVVNSAAEAESSDWLHTGRIAITPGREYETREGGHTSADRLKALNGQTAAGGLEPIDGQAPADGLRTEGGQAKNSGTSRDTGAEQQPVGATRRADSESTPAGAGKQSKAETTKQAQANEKAQAEGEVLAEASATMAAPIREYIFPPISLLNKPKDTGKGMSEGELKDTAEKLLKTLESFGVHVKLIGISCGPAVTRYELRPDEGVKVAQITKLSDDIKLNLAAADIRIEAPIPGKAAIGIEVPNKTNIAVMLRDILESKEFITHSSDIAFAVGRDISGQTIVSDIAKMPHLLIAGATGSGKSVCINTLVMSILYKANPADVRLIMVDPKVVELSVYNGIPHLLIPVVTDPKKASAALNWAVMEMTERYQKFAQMQVRDLKSYNEKISEEPFASDEAFVKLPQIVIIVDELADLMMVAPGEVEDAICRLAQMARAAGLHLIIATQRPSVNVITGVIKANVPSRIAFAVSSAIDSRTIIDGSGAEKLLGKGDMLFYPSGYPKPVRIQGAFVSDKEVSTVVDFIREQNQEPQYNTEVSEHLTKANASTDAGGRESSGGEYDEYFAEAGRFIIEKDKASIGMLQRAYRIGFNRAARIMDQLATLGVVSEEEGTKPRNILMSMEMFEQLIEELPV